MRPRRFFALLVAVFLTASLLVVPGSASSGAIHALDITAKLDRQGNAVISEIWDVTVPDSWTELYTVKSNLEDMKILHFQAEDLDTGKKFVSVGNEWNVNTGRAKKAGRCGIYKNDEGDLELCWGVGSSGRHRYRISYEMTNAVKSYTDGYDGFNIRFVNEGLSSEPEHVKVTISGPQGFTQKNTAMWAFGLEGKTSLQNGVIVAESSGQVNYCNILARFNDGIFQPASVSRQSFSRVKEKAMQKSSYEPEDDEGLTGAEIFGIGAIIAVLAGFYYFVRGRKDDSELVTGRVDHHALKDPPYSRSLPFDGSIEESYVVLKAISSHMPDSRIMSAYLLKWFERRLIRVEPVKSKHWSLLGEKSQAVITFPEADPELPEPEQKLWDILIRASGHDRTLQEKELYAWSKANYELIRYFYRSVEETGLEAGRANGDIELVPKRVLMTHQDVPGLSETGARRAVEMMGFRKYLKDFTIINERQAGDVGLWKDYLVFAALFGTADEVAKEFRELLPGYFTEPAENQPGFDPGWDAFDLWVFLNMTDHISTAAHSGYTDGMPNDSASSGLGGFTSLGGGGGFSGGGFGGGGR